MLLKDYNYHLPPECIAQTPIEPRDNARLLVYSTKDRSIVHSRVSEINKYLPEKCLIVANNSKVRKSRLFGLSPKGKLVEILILNPGNAVGSFECMIGGKVRIGDFITCYKDKGLTNRSEIEVEILEKIDHPSHSTFLLQFHSYHNLEQAIEESGHTPLPPYIKQEVDDQNRYQTIFAKPLGSVAAPTAGLHFTDKLILELKNSGHQFLEVTLHVGLGTFLPLRAENITDNQLHSEMTQISDSVASILNNKATDVPTLAIGTTTTRTLESHNQNGIILSGDLKTNIFIYPGYKFKSTDLLMTNFHLPKSSLLLMVTAFLADKMNIDEIEAREELFKIYSDAITNNYRFYSFGDAMLII